MLKIVQTVGDSVYDQPRYQDTRAARRYHAAFGGSGQPDDGDGIREDGEAYQGSYRGVLNNVFDPKPANNSGSGDNDCVAINITQADCS
ncbi:MAG: hypothetical protein WBB00_13790 [Mycobacterium sp.]